MGKRAFGANSIMAMAFAALYGQTVAPGGYTKMPFNSANLGDEQSLIDPGLLGLGRNPQEPEDGPVDNEGDVSVPVDLRYFGMWAKLLWGAPVTTQGVAAKGLLTFTAQPVANATITIGGQAFTFKAANPAANEILIGATVADTVRNTVWALNTSAVAGVAAASYSTDRNYATVIITHDTIGVGGNAMTIAAGGTSNVTVSGATLAGGSAVGPYNHVFTSGGQTQLDACIEISNPEVPSSGMNVGVMANTAAIAMQRGGNLRAAINLIAQGETEGTDSVAGALAEMALELFSQSTGAIVFDGVPLAEIVSASFNFSNNLEKAENVREDGKIDGADGAVCTINPQFVARFKDRYLRDLAVSKKVIDASWGWNKGPGKSLTFRTPSYRLPKTKKPVTGPGGIQQTYAGMAYQAIGKQALIVTLVNDVAAY